MQYTESIKQGSVINFKFLNSYEAEYVKTFCKINEEQGKYIYLTANCKLHIGLYYLQHDADEIKAQQKILESAKLGNIEAVRYLGDMYMKGIDGYKNYELAYIFTTCAVKHGSIDAIVNLGKMYECGIYVNKCIYKALKFYNSAIRHGNPRAIWHRDRLFNEHKDKFLNKYWYN